MNGRMIKKKTTAQNAKENCVFIYKKNQKRTDKQRKVSQAKYKIQIFLKAKYKTVYVLSTKLCVYIYMCVIHM